MHRGVANLLGPLLGLLLLVILCLGLAGAVEAHRLEVARNLFIAIIFFSCLSASLALLYMVHKVKKSQSSSEKGVANGGSGATNPGYHAGGEGKVGQAGQIVIIDPTDVAIERKESFVGR